MARLVGKKLAQLFQAGSTHDQTRHVLSACEHQILFQPNIPYRQRTLSSTPFQAFEQNRILTMKCVNCYSPLFPFHSQIKHRPQLKSEKVFLLSANNARSRTLLHKGKGILLPWPKAIGSSLGGLDLPYPATTGDMTVLLRTGAGFFFLYWLANFVVPEFVMKDLKKQIEEQREMDENPSKNAEGRASESRSSSSERKKKI